MIQKCMLKIAVERVSCMIAHCSAVTSYDSEYDDVPTVGPTQGHLEYVQECEVCS